MADKRSLVLAGVYEAGSLFLSWLVTISGQARFDEQRISCHENPRELLLDEM